jgi:4-amino-4-deoxy-L-arabinose transferase-like glycosyltransferase
MESISRNPLRASLALLLLSLATLFFRIGALPFVGADEPRYARIAEEMSGASSWVTPTLEHHAWLEKPPLYYWITIPFYRLAGTGEATARIAVALSAFGSMLAVYFLGRRLYSPLTGFLGASILGTSLGFVAFGRSASTDLPMTAAFTGALSLFAAATRGSLSCGAAWLGWALLGVSVLGKGPVALVLAFGVGVVFWALDERGGMLRSWRPITGALVCLAVAAPWFWLVFRENGWDFVLVFVINHNLARFVSDIHHHSQPVVYYLPVLAGLLLPWSGWLSLLLPGSLGAVKRAWQDRDRATVFLACWVAVPIIFFSAAQSKLPGYILPVLPPLSLLLGRRLEAFIGGAGKRRGLAWALISTSTLMAVGLCVLFTVEYRDPVSGIWIAAAAWAPGLAAFRFALGCRWRQAVVATMAQGVALVLAITLLGFGAIGAHHSARDVAQAALGAGGDRTRIVTYRYFHHTLNYYSGYRVAADTTDPVRLDAALAESPGAFVVTRGAHLAELARAGYRIAVLHRQAELVLATLSRQVDSPGTR